MLADEERVRANIKAATTEDLLDRAAIWREGMEAQALEWIDAELAARGVSATDQTRHAEARADQILLHADGLPARCQACRQPAVATEKTWYRLVGLLPLFRYRAYYCADHRPERLRSPELPSTADLDLLDLDRFDGGSRTAPPAEDRIHPKRPVDTSPLPEDGLTSQPPGDPRPPG